MHRSPPDKASSRSTLAVAVIGLAAACLPTLVHAQSPGTWPVRPIRMMLGFAPGGPADIVGRTIAPKLTELLGQQVIIENRGGAGGTVATELVARSTPDGYTLTLASQSSYVFAPWLYPKLGYDPVKDFAPISTVVNTPYVVAINPRVPAKTVADLVRLGKGKKAFLTFGSSGPGATSHIGGELLAQATGMPLLHVPYKGTGPSLAALVAGEIDIMIADLGPVLNMVKDGRLRVLAGFGAKRTGAMPRSPDHGRGRLQDASARRPLRRDRAGGRLQGHHQPAAFGRGADHEDARRPPAIRGAGLRGGRRHPRAVRPVHPRGTGGLRQAHPRSRDQARVARPRAARGRLDSTAPRSHPV